MKLHLNKSLLVAVLCGIGTAQAAEILHDQTTTKQKLQEIYGKTDVVWTGSDTDTTVDYSRNTLTYGSNAQSMLKIDGTGYGHSPSLSISKYQDVSFDENTSKATTDRMQGTVCYLAGDYRTGSENALLSITNNSAVSFNENTGTSNGSYAYGGAIYMDDNSTVEICENDSVSLSQNFLASSNYAFGGAIYVAQDSYDTGERNSHVTISNNKDVNFIGNTVSSQQKNGYGGAIYVASRGSVDLNDNTGKVNFINNGVSYKSDAEQQHGGAIYLSDATAQLSIRGNNEVVFAGNYELNTYSDTYCLRSISANKKDTQVLLSAKAGGSIEFRDSIYINGNINLNKDYNGTAQTGKIIFTGRTTVEDLEAAIAANTAEGVEAREATEQEIINSRTSVITGTLAICNGTLSLQDGAIIDATTVTIASGAELEVLLTAEQGITTFGLEEAAIAATLDAKLNLEEGASLTIDGGLLDMQGHNVILGNNVTINAKNLTVNNDNTVTLFSNIKELTLAGNAAEDGTITLNINGVEQEATYNALNGSITITADAIPEPTTATLSLLALAALAARRRRR